MLSCMRNFVFERLDEITWNVQKELKVAY
jgi:hypothetical protein